MKDIINVNTDDWIEDISKIALTNHLICTGKRSTLQWFGTKLIQEVGNFPNSEISPIYGKLVSDFDSFCYQLCHSTPWGFEMGRNMNAVRDVIRGEGFPQNKFFIIYDAQYMYLDDFRHFEALFRIFLEVDEESHKNLKVIILLEDREDVRIRKLLRRKEKYQIHTLRIIQEE
jgi:hypothetical protein